MDILKSLILRFFHEKSESRRAGCRAKIQKNSKILKILQTLVQG